MEGEKKNRWKWFWLAVSGSIAIRLLLIMAGLSPILASRPEISSPLTSIHRLAEGHWLKQLGLSPYAGSLYHGSPLLVSVLGPLTSTRAGQQKELLCSLIFVLVDLITSLLLLRIGDCLHHSFIQSITSLHLGSSVQRLVSGNICPGDIAALVYLWNPLTILSCVGASTSAIENFMVVVALFGACADIAPLAAFGWVMSTHLALYPAIMIVPVIFLLGFGLDRPPQKVFQYVKDVEHTSSDKTVYTRTIQEKAEVKNIQSEHKNRHMKYKPVMVFVFWSLLWGVYILALCSISLKHHGGLDEMFKETYGFILYFEDLSPNLGLFWYFFTEVFDFFRMFFLLIFHSNILFMISPLGLRFCHRPCFLAFVLLTIISLLKSYPSLGDAALYLGLMPLFIHELAGMHFPFLLLNGFTGVMLLSPVMYNIWIWRGTGNANFYFATSLVYACLQIILILQSAGTMLSYDRSLKKLINGSSLQKLKVS